MDFKIIIKEQREELEQIVRKERIIKRERIEEAKKFLDYPNILAITGVRRCGKSIFSYLLSKDKSFGYLNFDDERLSEIKKDDLNKILQSFYELYGDIEFIILDEIQNVEKWELFVNRLRRTKRVIITGSNSRLLSGELATYLTGRYIDFSLLPFSFREFLDFKNFVKKEVYTTKDKAEILNLLNEYLQIGGFPEVHKFGKSILIRIYEDIITKDILLQYKIKKINEFKNLAKYLISNFCEEISYRKLTKILKLKHISTLSNWLSYLENSFLILKLERFDFKLKQQFLSPKKVYCIDTGIINAISFKFSENFGKFLENSVIIELHRRKGKDNSLEIYYWKDYRGNEVDFVIKKGAFIKQLIQVTYALDRHEIKEREINALIKASNELKCKNLSILTWDYEGEEKINKNKINFIPLWKWLQLW